MSGLRKQRGSGRSPPCSPRMTPFGRRQTANSAAFRHNSSSSRRTRGAGRQLRTISGRLSLSGPAWQGKRIFCLPRKRVDGSLLWWSDSGQFAASRDDASTSLRQRGGAASEEGLKGMQEMEKCGDELKDVLKIQHLTLFSAANEQHFARKMMPKCAPKRPKILHFAKNELKLLAFQAPRRAAAGGLHEARPKQKAANTEGSEKSSRSSQGRKHKPIVFSSGSEAFLCELCVRPFPAGNSRWRK